MGVQWVIVLYRQMAKDRCTWSPTRSFVSLPIHHSSSKFFFLNTYCVWCTLHCWTTQGYFEWPCLSVQFQVCVLTYSVQIPSPLQISSERKEAFSPANQNFGRDACRAAKAVTWILVVGAGGSSREILSSQEITLILIINCSCHLHPTPNLNSPDKIAKRTGVLQGRKNYLKVTLPRHELRKIISLCFCVCNSPQL